MTRELESVARCSIENRIEHPRHWSQTPAGDRETEKERINVKTNKEVKIKKTKEVKKKETEKRSESSKRKDQNEENKAMTNKTQKQRIIKRRIK